MLARGPPRARAPLLPARCAGRLLRRRGGDDRPRRRQGGAPGHVPDRRSRSGGPRSASAACRSGPVRRSTWTRSTTTSRRAFAVSRGSGSASPCSRPGRPSPATRRRAWLVLSRFDREDRREYLVAFNAGEDDASVTVTTATPSTRWAQLFGSDVKVAETDAAGRISIGVPALGAVVARADGQLPRRGAARATLRFGADRFTNAHGPSPPPWRAPTP